jgi:isocitrate dehydrogenase
MDKIRMQNPIVEIDGDEMTRVMWSMIKDTLLLPYIDLNTAYFDLSLTNRDKTDDSVTTDSAMAILKYKVAVKCATITPNAQRVEEYSLKKMWKSPNGTIRERLDGTVFRQPILTSNIRPVVTCWEKPIIIARHAYGDIYAGVEFVADRPGKAKLVYTYDDGSVKELDVFRYEDKGILQALYNKDSSIESFARSCFDFAIEKKMDLWFSTKDTISKKYDHHFKDIFSSIYENEYKSIFTQIGIEYFYTLIDDAAARIMRSKGGFIWALKNYDGDVMSDLVSSAFGSFSMMTSVLVSPNGEYEYEAAHGTVTKHYYNYIKGIETSTNPIATIFAWTGALRKRGELDGNKALIDFSVVLQKSCLEVIEDGFITKDLQYLITNEVKTVMNTKDFINKIAERLKENLK